MTRPISFQVALAVDAESGLPGRSRSTPHASSPPSTGVGSTTSRSVLSWSSPTASCATADIDLVARQCCDSLERLAAAFAELHARLRGVDADLLEIDPTDPDTLANGASFTLDTDAGPVDYLNDVPGAGDYADLRARSVETIAAGVVVRVVGLDDLIRMKRASGRPQDLRDIANLSPPSEGTE